MVNRHLFLGKIESQASSAIPVLEEYVSAGVANQWETAAAAVALVRIDPGNQLAMSHLEARLVHSGTNSPGEEILNASYAKGSLNKTVADRAILQFGQPRKGTAALWVLMHHDPDAAVLLGRSRLAQKRDELDMVRLLLRHDPNDPEALAAIRRKVAHPDFVADPNRRYWLEPLEHSYSNSTQALEILDLAEQFDDAVIKATVRNLRRHVELNDQLRLWREETGND